MQPQPAHRATCQRTTSSLLFRVERGGGVRAAPSGGTAARQWRVGTGAVNGLYRTDEWTRLEGLDCRVDWTAGAEWTAGKTDHRHGTPVRDREAHWWEAQYYTAEKCVTTRLR